MARPIELDWRDGAGYDYVDRLTHEQYGFECLRRNPDYADAYRRMKAEAEAGRTEAAERLAALWGLRFRARSKPARGSCQRRLASTAQPAPRVVDEQLAGAWCRSCRALPD